MTKCTVLILALAVGLAPLPCSAAQTAQANDDVDRKEMAERVKEEFLHAWRGYTQYAWGHDELRPLSKTFKDWYPQPLYMTPVDALDTLIVMGLTEEADKARALIADNLSFDHDITVSNLEITIRLLGGLLSGYEMTGDRRLLALAEDLGTRLLPVFDSPTGIPYRFVNLKTGRVDGADSNPSEAGTLLVEFGTLSRLTGNPVFYDKAKRALVEIFKRRSPIGLVGQNIDVETGKWIKTDSHLSAGIDSYYEYLLKSWLLFGDEDCGRMWEDSIKAVNTYLADEADTGLWYCHASMRSGWKSTGTFDALEGFFPAVLALSGDLDRAERLQASCYRMWQVQGVAPERINYKSMRIRNAVYRLRPEIVESTYYLYHFTGDPRYLRMGKTMFEDFVRYCRTDAGYAALSDVVTKEKADEMQSYLFAETFKYFYLLFAPPGTVNFEDVIFNTEAHPLKRRSRGTIEGMQR